MKNAIISIIFVVIFMTGCGGDGGTEKNDGESHTDNDMNYSDQDEETDKDSGNSSNLADEDVWEKDTDSNSQSDLDTVNPDDGKPDEDDISEDDSDLENDADTEKSDIGEDADNNITTLRVFYNGNESTGGEVPVDSNNYKSGDEVTILGNTGLLEKEKFIFSGWCDDQNSEGSCYDQGDKLTMESSDITLYAKWTERVYKAGDTGPAGGIIFYVNPNAETDGWKYLEAAPKSIEWTSATWGAKGILIGTETGLGTGKSNTAKIIEWLNTNGETDRAAQLCESLTYNGFDDWFLPSRMELKYMYAVKSKGQFAEEFYWSSSESDEDSIDVMTFKMSIEATSGKDGTNYVRAVRSF